MSVPHCRTAAAVPTSLLTPLATAAAAVSAAIAAISMPAAVAAVSMPAVMRLPRMTIAAVPSPRGGGKLAIPDALALPVCYRLYSLWVHATWSAGRLDALAPELARLLRWSPRLMRGICVDCRAILTAVILVVRSRGKELRALGLRLRLALFCALLDSKPVQTKQGPALRWCLVYVPIPLLLRAEYEPRLLLKWVLHVEPGRGGGVLDRLCVNHKYINKRTC